MEDLEHKLYSLQDADALSHARCPFLSSLSPSGDRRPRRETPFDSMRPLSRPMESRAREARGR